MRRFKSNLKLYSLRLIIVLLIILLSATFGFSQEDMLKFTVDFQSKTRALPKIFSPSVDVSGRGHHRDMAWPYHLAAKETLEKWHKEINFKGVYRLYWDIWELEKVKLDPPLRNMLLANYEGIIKQINEVGGIVILSLYGSPPGMGRVLDRRSPPSNLKQWKKLIKETIRYLSCEKRYNIWYEVWSAPDTEEYFLGTKKDYLNLYRMVAEAVRELKRETKINISVGGPATTWWFQNFEGNTIITPEKSLIYELIRFCFKRKLPLDFISWHAFSTDPQAEKEITSYNKTLSVLIQDWLKYFRFKQKVPLIVDEWNFDNGSNIIEERGSKSFIAASYIPARLYSMYKTGIDYQIFFSMEDFQDNKYGINTNRGIFHYDGEGHQRLTHPKSIYNAFLMLNSLGSKMFDASLEDQFVQAFATREGKDRIVILLWNYIDPFMAKNYIARQVALLNKKDRKLFINMVKSGDLDRLFRQEFSLESIKAGDKLKGMLEKAQQLNKLAESAKEDPRNISINLLNLSGEYNYQRYKIDNLCISDCKYMPTEEKEIEIDGNYQEICQLSPYSVMMIVLTKKADPDPGEGGPKENK